MAPFNVMALKNPNPFISMQPKIFCLKKKKNSKTSGLDSSLCLAFRREAIILNTYA
jgi:hypothetical protein